MNSLWGKTGKKKMVDHSLEMTFKFFSTVSRAILAIFKGRFCK